MREEENQDEEDQEDLDNHEEEDVRPNINQSGG